MFFILLPQNFGFRFLIGYSDVKKLQIFSIYKKISEPLVLAVLAGLPNFRLNHISHQLSISLNS